MDLSVKLDAFEGPLDLLLHLIEKNKIDIYDIPIAEITDQYMEYVSHMELHDLDLVSEFLVMAATLLDIKSRMLLPKEEETEEEEDDPRQELAKQLVEYKMFKEISRALQEREERAAGVFYREEDIPKEVACYREPMDLDKLLDGVTLIRLNEIFQMVMKKQEDKIDPVRSRFGRIEKEPMKVEDKISTILSVCREKKTFSFRELLERQRDKFEVVVTFLAVLELMKIGAVSLTQEVLFGEIIIEAAETEDALNRLEAEWENGVPEGEGYQ